MTPETMIEVARPPQLGKSPARKVFSVALYRTEGNRKRQHVVVLYLGVDCDWTDIQRSRNGNKMWCHLASAPETPAAQEYREAVPRARSLTYSGKAPADLAGLKQDLESLDFDAATVSRMVEKARPYFPTAQSHPQRENGHE